MLLTDFRDQLISVADQRSMAVANRLNGGFLSTSRQHRKHAAQRQTEEYTQNLFHSV